MTLLTDSNNFPIVLLLLYHHASSSHPAFDSRGQYNPQDRHDRHQNLAYSWPMSVMDPPVCAEKEEDEKEARRIRPKRPTNRPTDLALLLTTIANHGQSLLSVNLCQANWVWTSVLDK